MSFFGTIPLLISMLVGFLVALVAVGLLGLGRGPTEKSSPGKSDALLLGLLALAAFGMGVFLSYFLFGLLL
jgi:hypothetical protein